ncbi:MAG TPA: NADH:flavin oxidoreductase [Geobacteraceae bacterium]|nr:NADH:flavin oxidoreductase [Geobacteraceae bacterium]
MHDLFDKTVINGMPLNNRLVRSATWEGMCEPDGRPTEKLVKCYGGLAAGGVGLLISGYAFIRPDGKQFPGQMGIHTDAFAPEMKALTAAVHDHGGKICMQLVHCGGQTTTAMAGSRPVAPSAVETPQYQEVPAELSRDDIAELIALFSAGAARAREYGFDAVQLHAAHGYLINQFLSPLTNRRDDRFGGNPENRRRFLMDVYQGVRGAVGGSFPVLVKLNGADNLEGGLELSESILAAKALAEVGIDAIEVSGGTPSSGDRSPVRVGIKGREMEAYNLPLAGRIKEAVGCPVMTVGGIRTFEVADGIIRRGDADYIAMSRPFIREPALARRWQSGNGERATCISCNGCFKPGLKEGGIYCVMEKIEREGKKTSI